MRVSAGVIITDGKRFLTGIPSGKYNKRDLLKGGIEEGENPVDAAVREVEEECGLKINPSNLQDLGRMSYLPEKDLHLFVYTVSQLPDPKSLKCESYFTDEVTGKKTPEMAGFDLLTYEDAEKKMYPKLFAVISSMLREILE